MKYNGRWLVWTAAGMSVFIMIGICGMYFFGEKRDITQIGINIIVIIFCGFYAVYFYKKFYKDYDEIRLISIYVWMFAVLFIFSTIIVGWMYFSGELFRQGHHFMSLVYTFESVVFGLGAIYIFYQYKKHHLANARRFQKLRF